MMKCFVPNFELSKVKEGVFGLASRLYDITFKKNPGIPVYHKDVEPTKYLIKTAHILLYSIQTFIPEPENAPVHG